MSLIKIYCHNGLLLSIGLYNISEMHCDGKVCEWLIDLGDKMMFYQCKIL